ncbi:MAG: PTPA-CTERM sorting domain-containing protein [Synechococcales bacterium]|nr:PTPA-CTERM sorting domain-containing protein [Synechococcales bacterium]
MLRNITSQVAIASLFAIVGVGALNLPVKAFTTSNPDYQEQISERSQQYGDETVVHVNGKYKSIVGQYIDQGIVSSSPSEDPNIPGDDNPPDSPEPTPIPTPAMLPGIIGFGLATLRKKLKAQDANQ